MKPNIAQTTSQKEKALLQRIIAETQYRLKMNLGVIWTTHGGNTAQYQTVVSYYVLVCVYLIV